MAYREIISNELRFKIFQRDNFTCQYCGAKAPDVTLEIDHIRPVSKGGDKRESNLITSCYSCNRGKKDTLVPEMEDETAQEDFEKNFEKYKHRYGYYTNYIAKVIENNIGRKPIKINIDKFANRSFKTDEEFNEFKKEFNNFDNAQLIIKSCIRNSMSYKAYKNAYTDVRNELIKTYYTKDIYHTLSDIGVYFQISDFIKNSNIERSGFKPNFIENSLIYYIAKSLSEGMKIESMFRTFNPEKYATTCIEMIKKYGRENVYEIMFNEIDNYFDKDYRGLRLFIKILNRKLEQQEEI